MPNRHALKLRELLHKLKDFGVVQMPGNRGDGSEIILVRPVEIGTLKGPQYPIKNHGLGKDVPIAVTRAALRRFGIDEKAFW